MKRFVKLLAGFLVIAFFTSTALAIEIIPKNGIYEPSQEPIEPIVTPDPRAVLIGSEETDYVENGEFEDTGTVWVYWNDTAYSKYGCSIADINYTNPNRSNIGVTLSIGIFDGDMIEYFGTTFRTDEEVQKYAMMGYEALQDGISLSNASYLVAENGIFEGMTEEEVSLLGKSEIAEFLGDKNFIGMTKEELMSLDEEKVKELSEINKLTLAQLGGYNFYTYCVIIGEAGVINPGYALYQIELYTLPGVITIPKGEYRAVFVLNGYDANKNELSDFFIHLPITLQIAEDLPEELQIENGITLATRIDK